MVFAFGFSRLSRSKLAKSLSETMLVVDTFTDVSFNFIKKYLVLKMAREIAPKMLQHYKEQKHNKQQKHIEMLQKKKDKLAKSLSETMLVVDTFTDVSFNFSTLGAMSILNFPPGK
jgi:putative ribosome biogenesis GTPase RsgA